MMTVNYNILKEFVKITNDDMSDAKTIPTLRGTIITNNGLKCVKIDGSEIITPVTTTTDIEHNDRVMVNIANHRAIIVGNISDPSVGNNRVENAEDSINEFEHLFAGNITADNIQAGAITADKITAGAITADKITAGAITADKIAADSIEAEHIQAGVIQAEHIQAGTITGDLIQGDTITGEHIQAGSIVAGDGIIANGSIGNAQISNLTADKISSGTIDTSKIDVSGPSGNLLIRGNRVQVFNGHGNDKIERVSMGDVNNDGSVYGLRVRGVDGETILLDENGVTGEGITDGSITNEHISGETKIDGYKLNINSVVREINESTETISGTKIDIDGTSLSTSLYTIVNTQTEQGEHIERNSSDIKANQDNISLKVDGQQYESDKESLTESIQKNTSAIEMMDDSINIKVEESISKVGVGANNYIENSGDFVTKDRWNGCVEVVDKELIVEGDVVNTTDISVSPNQSYIMSATIKLPTNFVMTEANLLKYIIKGGMYDGDIDG